MSNPQYISEGTLVEFLSDRQTDKGPSSGRVVYNNGQDIAIQHSDGVEWFSAIDLEVERVTRRKKDGKVLWKFK